MTTDYRKLINRGQESVLEAAREWRRAQEQAVTELRDAGATFAGQLPTPAELIEANYGVAAQLLQLQKEAALFWADVPTF